MPIKKSKFTFKGQVTIFLLWLEKKYKKNKLNFNVVYFATLISAIWKILSALSAKHEQFYIDLSAILPLLVTISHFLFYCIYRFFIREYFISFSGVGKHEVTYSFDQLTKGGIISSSGIEGDLIFKSLTFSGYLKKKYIFPYDERTKKLAGEINYVTFMDTVWSGKSEGNKEDELNALNKKIARNKGHLSRNPKSIMLIKNTQNYWMGFTHILPVNALIWEKYLRGEIADSNFAAYNICKPGESAYGFIIFSIGSLLKFSYMNLPRVITEHLDDQINDAMERERMTYHAGEGKKYVHNLSTIYKGVLFHLNELIDSHFKHIKMIPLMVQIEDSSLRKVFEGNNFIKHKDKSKDGYDIYTAHLILNKEEEAFVD